MNARMMVPLAALAIAAAACGSSSGSTASTNTAPVAQPTKAAPAGNGTATVDLASSKFGKILVNAKGQTLYLWAKDSGGKSACSGACAGAWPALTATGAPTGGSGVAVSKLGTSKRSDGTMQVTYAGHPLYTFAGDSSAGSVNGEGSNGFGATWYVVDASGSKIAPTTTQGGY